MMPRRHRPNRLQHPRAARQHYPSEASSSHQALHLRVRRLCRPARHPSPRRPPPILAPSWAYRAAAASDRWLPRPRCRPPRQRLHRWPSCPPPEKTHQIVIVGRRTAARAGRAGCAGRAARLADIGSRALGSHSGGSTAGAATAASEEHLHELVLISRAISRNLPSCSLLRSAAAEPCAAGRASGRAATSRRSEAGCRAQDGATLPAA